MATLKFLNVDFGGCQFRLDTALQFVAARSLLGKGRAQWESAHPPSYRASVLYPVFTEGETMQGHGRLVLVLFLAVAAITAQLLIGSMPAAAQKKNKTLQVMFLDGAAIRASPSNQADKLTTAECGESLVVKGKRQEAWYPIELDGAKGWVNGYLVTFDTKVGDYCHKYAPQEVLVNAGLALPPPPPAAEISTAAVQVEQPVASGYGSIEDVICQAAINYGQSCQAMIAVAMCESTLSPNAVGGLGEMGLFQFLPGTWASTPYAGQDPFDPVANANAAAWMWSMGRRGEWYC